MPDPRILTRGALPPGSEVERVFNEVMTDEKATIGEQVQAQQWSAEARDACRRALDDVEAHLPDGWTLRRLPEPGAFEVLCGSQIVAGVFSGSLTLGAWRMHADATIAEIRRVAGKG